MTKIYDDMTEAMANRWINQEILELNQRAEDLGLSMHVSSYAWEIEDEDEILIDLLPDELTDASISDAIDLAKDFLECRE